MPSGSPGLEELREERLGVGVGAVELEARGAGVAGRGDEDRSTDQLERLDAEPPGQGEGSAGEALEDARRRRALEREQGGRIAAVVDADVGGCAARDPALDPAPVLVDVRGVHAEEERVLGEPRHDDVVDAASRVVQHQPVARPAEPESEDVAGHERVGSRRRVAAREMDLAHVRHVEEAGALAHRGVLLEDRAVLDRHLEAREGDEARAEPAVGLVEGRPVQRAQAFGPAGFGCGFG
jgi:hypothetical protein